MLSVPPTPCGKRQAEPQSLQWNPIDTDYKHPTSQDGVKRQKRGTKGTSKLDENKSKTISDALPGPLSSLPEFDHIPLHVADIESFVNRSVDTRHFEIETGKPKKSGNGQPLNAFFLYRKCCLARAQAFSKSHLNSEPNYGLILAESWKKETEFRGRLTKLSEIDYRKHYEAFPESRPQWKRQVLVGQDDEDSGLEDTSVVAPESACAPRSARPPSDAGQESIGYTPTSYTTFQLSQSPGPVVRANCLDLGLGLESRPMHQHGSSNSVAPPQMHQVKVEPPITSPLDYYEMAEDLSFQPSSTLFLPNNALRDPRTNATTSTGNSDIAPLYPELETIDLSVDEYTAFLLEIDTYSKNEAADREALPTG